MDDTRFLPTRHSAQRLAERFFPGLDEETAYKRLARMARSARPLKVKVGR